MKVKLFTREEASQLEGQTMASAHSVSFLPNGWKFRVYEDYPHEPADVIACKIDVSQDEVAAYEYE